MTPDITGQGLSRGLTLLFAVAGGAAVGNLYWAQPLLVQMATDLGVEPAAAGLLVTWTQIGYALGILLLVPLGDTLPRHRLIPAVMAASVMALVGAAFAPGFAVLALALGLLGLSSVAGQVIIPLAGDLATATQRGRAVGTIVSGVLTGVLVSRTVSGLIASVMGWRAVYAAAAVITVTLLLLIARATPRLPNRVATPYPSLIASVFTTTAQIPAARWLLLIAGCHFGVFNLFWTATTFLLSAEPYGYSTAQIGLVSLVGIAGAVAAQRIGILEDTGHGTAAMGAFGLVAAVGMAITWFATTSIWSVLVGALILNVGIQGAGVLTQTRLLSLSTHARSRLNTALVTSNFLFGATCSALAAWLWRQGGWPAVAIGGMAVLGLGLLTWIAAKARLNAIAD